MWAVVPLKSLDQVKQRLATRLSPAERQSLALAMAADCLAALRSAHCIEKVFVLSQSSEVHALAARLGAEVLSLADDTSLNAGVTAAVNELAARGATHVMIVHSDLPLARADDFDALATHHHQTNAQITLCPATRKDGTNVMAITLPTTLQFMYGPDSFQQHLAQAEQRGIAYSVIENHRLSCDIDAPDDLDNLALQHRTLLTDLATGQLPTASEALYLSACEDTTQLMQLASASRDRGFNNVVTYSKKVFIPLTHLCRDVCHYCTFAEVPREVRSPYMSLDDVLTIARAGAAAGCKEALFTLGERPELRYRAAREALDTLGFATTLDYLRHVADAVFRETGLLPHLNPGCMSAEEIAILRPVSPSMGIMLETASLRLSEKGMPHHGSPDKEPARRLATLEEAGKAQVPFTTGILIGIGETRTERVEALLAIRQLHQRYGHIQEIIVQNFRAKPDTKMAQAPEPDLNELLWTIAIARLIFGSAMSIQAPPNLSPGVLPQLLQAGINDWGGVSPLTPDYVNPEAPWPHLDNLARETAVAGKYLQERLTIYPVYVRDYAQWSDAGFHTALLRATDGDGFPRNDDWLTGTGTEPPAEEVQRITQKSSNKTVSPDIAALLNRYANGAALSEADIVRLFRARGDDFNLVCQAADQLRAQLNSDTVTYAVNRNINYTNVCYFRCQFCAFSKGKLSENLRGRPYDLSDEEIQRRVHEAWSRGATEVCLQGGIHPDYDGNKYLHICKLIHAAEPRMHIHAFSPLEVTQGAETLGQPLAEYLRALKNAGLHTLPGTAAEILDDEVRAIICPDKINTAQWLNVMRTAHSVGLPTTATIMFGHVDHYHHWARHLLRVLELQQDTGGFTEFVPLPFVASEAPIFLRGKARKGPTFRECVLMHAIARLVLSPLIKNIQASWVKLGPRGVEACLHAGVNDLGGTLMNESITRAAGASHGEENSPQALEQIIGNAQRKPLQRNTLYQPAPAERVQTAWTAAPLLHTINTPAKKFDHATEHAVELTAQTLTLSA